MPGIPGDPIAMKAKATLLRSLARELHTWAHGVDERVDGMEFEGRAARRVRHRVDAWKGKINRAGDELYNLSRLLDRSAADVAALQAAERRRLRKAAEDLF